LQDVIEYKVGERILYTEQWRGLLFSLQLTSLTEERKTDYVLLINTKEFGTLF
jgi:hypothetical protein